MSLTDCIQATRQAHELLRRRAAGTRPDEQCSAAYRTVKSGLDELWTAAQQHLAMQQLQAAIEKLTVDAQYFAGLSDSEGFRDAAEVWQQYAYLEGTMC
jgi:hypothetical protein